MSARTLLASVAALAAASAHAQPLDPVVVTATRVATPLAETVAPVIVIDRETIERSLAADVAELLRFHAGLELGRNGGPGQTTSLFMRGSESNHALVLVDGIEINPGTIGGAALQNLSPRLIERIEIVKGPRSSLYGSDAIGGVINVITREARGLHARIAAGRYGTRELSAGAGATLARGDLSVSVSRYATDGFPTRTGAGLPDRGHDAFSAGINARVTAGASTLALRHWHSSGTTEYLDFLLAPREQDYLNRATALDWRVPATDTWDSTLTLSQIEDDVDQRQDADFVRTRRDVAEWQNTFSLRPGHDLVAGLYLAREHTESLSFGAGFDERTDVDALFVEDIRDFGRHRLVLAARYTEHEGFGAHTTWNAEYAHEINELLTISAAAGSAFRAPDATDRFGFGGNPELEPERSRSYELALRARSARHRATLTLFHNRVDDLIDFVFDAETLAGGNVNVARARIEGIEARHEASWVNWRITTTALLQDPRDLTTDRQLSRRARRSLSVNLARDFGPLSLGLDLLATSRRPDSSFTETINAGYVLASLAGRLELSRHWALQGRLDNLLDTNYETAAGFRSPGRGLYLAAQYRTR